MGACDEALGVSLGETAPSADLGLRSSKFSFEYLLLPPRSALGAVSPRLTPKASSQAPMPLLLIDATQLQQWLGIGHPLKRHPFSGLVHSAGELLHTP